MSKYKCINCVWEGEVLSVKPLIGKCPRCGDKVSGKLMNPIQEPAPIPIVVKEVKNKLDLDGDGDVDKDDRSLAAKVLRSSPKSGRKKRGKR